MTWNDKYPDLRDLRLAIALPSYDGSALNRVPLMYAFRHLPNAVPLAQQSSLLACCFNLLLAAARNMRDHGRVMGDGRLMRAADGTVWTPTHFLMVHADIVPVDEEWFQHLWAAYVESNAQMLCAVAPIKDNRGLTSVAVEASEVDKPRRLTLREIAQGPTTFTLPGILLNTGCLLFDLREPWVDKVFFHIDDSIEMVDVKGAPTPAPKSASEDWNFTRDARKAGCERIYATTRMRLEHVGQVRFPNYVVGGLEHDDGT